LERRITHDESVDPGASVRDRVLWCGTTAGPLPPGYTKAFAGGFDGSTGQWLPTFVLGGYGTTYGHECADLGGGRFVLAGRTASPEFPWVGSSYAASDPLVQTGPLALFLSILRAL
jgi:hypothetical protein